MNWIYYYILRMRIIKSIFFYGFVVWLGVGDDFCNDNKTAKLVVFAVVDQLEVNKLVGSLIITTNLHPPPPPQPSPPSYVSG